MIVVFRYKGCLKEEGRKIVLFIYGALNRDNVLKLQRIRLGKYIYSKDSEYYNKFPEYSVSLYLWIPL